MRDLGSGAEFAGPGHFGRERLHTMVTRRQLLRMGGGAALGVSGAVALAACGETQIVTKEVPVETVVI